MPPFHGSLCGPGLFCDRGCFYHHSRRHTYATPLFPTWKNFQRRMFHRVRVQGIGFSDCRAREFGAAGGGGRRKEGIIPYLPKPSAPPIGQLALEIEFLAVSFPSPSLLPKNVRIALRIVLQFFYARSSSFFSLALNIAVKEGGGAGAHVHLRVTCDAF